MHLATDALGIILTLTMMVVMQRRANARLKRLAAAYSRERARLAHRADLLARSASEAHTIAAAHRAEALRLRGTDR